MKRKFVRKKKLFPVFIALFISLLSAYLLQQYLSSHKKRIYYQDFGISIPNGFDIHGIDVSRYQRDIDWEAVASMKHKGISFSFAVAKATEGLSLKDPYFKKNWREMGKTNLTRGAYLFFHPRKSGKEQAYFFIKHVSLNSGDLAPVIDIENTNKKNKKQIQASLKECIDVLQHHYGIKPIIYTGADFYTQYLLGEFDAYPLWVAHYNNAKEPNINHTWLIWQHNEKGRVNGIIGNVDFNVLKGNKNSLKKLCIP